MAIENELKYVLIPKPVLNTLVDNYITDIFQLKQGYLSKHARIRNSFNFKLALSEFTFTYKILLLSGELEEFEQNITEDSFVRCFSLAEEKISKIRYSTKIGDEKWDIDIFQFKDYSFSMAECEMPSGREAPIFLPDFIKTNTVYAVPREETELFTSHKLTNPDYVNSIIKKFHLNEWH